MAGRWVSLSSNKAETGDLIDVIVGLSRAQFTQVILLPQGEFARFLRSDDDARRAVLTKLFGTELYDKITAELDRRRAEAVRARQAAAGEIAAAVSAAAEAAGLDAAARTELIVMPTAARSTALRQLSDDLATALTDAVAALEQAAADEQAAQAAEQEATRQAALMTRLTDALRSLHVHESGRGEHDLRSGRLDAARRAEPVRSLLAVLGDAEAAAERDRAALRELFGTDAAASAPGDDRQEPAAGELGCLLDPDADHELVRRTSQEAARRAEAAQRAAAGLDHLVADESAVAGRESALTGLGRIAADAAAAAEALTAIGAELPARITAAEAELATARDLASNVSACQRRQTELTRLQSAAARLAEIEPLLAAATVRLQSAVDAHQSLVDAHQRAMDGRLAGLAAELAAGLADGSACPVCGSADHPAPAAASAAQVTAEAVSVARERRDAAETTRRRAQREHADLDKEATEQAAIAAGHSMADLCAEAADVAVRLAAGERAR